MFASAHTLDITWQFQIQHPDGSWHHYSQAEYTNEHDCRTAASQVYSGQVETRIVKISREVMA